MMRCGTCGLTKAECKCVEKGVGTKLDLGKLQYDLVDTEALRLLATILSFGAKKYGPQNWRTLPGWRDRYYAAALRHLEAWRAGEWADPESGYPHLAHAFCNVMFMLALSCQEERARTEAPK